MKHLLLIFSLAFLLVACNDNSGNVASEPDKADSSKAEKEESREDRNKRIVKEAMAAMNDKDIDKVFSMMSEDAVDYGDGSKPPLKNRDSIRTSMTAFLKAFPDFKGDNLRYFADGDQVVVTGEWSGTFKNDYGKYKATGKSFKFKDADIFTLNDEGKISEHRFIQPDATIFNQVMADKKK